MTLVYVIIGISFLLCLGLTPLVIKMARKFGFVDIPKDSRRVHTKPMPRIGGLAIVISMIVGLGIYYLLTRNIPQIALGKQFVGYAIAGLIIATMGFIDDAFTLRARFKFIFEMAAAITLYAFNVRISGITVPFLDMDMIDLKWLDFPVTVIWILAVTNALNLIDGLDGLSAGIASIAATSLLIIFIATSASLEAIVITATLVGATLGFLPYNFNPAKTFMGDVGSNFLGLTLATVSILGFAKGYTMIAIIAPILAIGVPLFDTIFAMVRRIAKGQPPLRPDGAHIHHRLLKRGFNQRQAVLILYLITTVLCILAVLLVSADIWKISILVVAAICFCIMGILNMKKCKEIKKLDEGD